jgi:site-specific DNA-methyltransferase (adenine-specific)
MRTEILCGDNLPILREMADNSVDAIVTDPPYGLSFMGKRWDYDVPSVELWAECLRVLKPGGHLLAFAGTRTQHRMAVRIEDAGFEIRDMIAWVYGSGFPKSLDIGKAIDKAAGVEREVVGVKTEPNGRNRLNEARGVTERKTWGNGQSGFTESIEKRLLTTPATEAARQWQGWGTALKPALEPITLARKPLAERTVAANVLEWGTGGVNVDGCRVGTENTQRTSNANTNGDGWGMGKVANLNGSESGRFPANFIHDGSDEVVGLFPVTTSGDLKSGHKQGSGMFGSIGGDTILANYGGDTGSAARFFYCAKASRSEREAGLEGNKCTHPTVKPIALMRYLCRLVTPPGGIVLDPFTGSGTTGCAATLEGFGFVGIEREAEYAEIARRRVEHWREVASQDEASIEDVQEKLFAEMV